jgi:cell division protein FtsI/penicillin-binding protein 2
MPFSERENMMTNETKKKKKSHVPFRLNILFLMVFLLFSILILRLGVVQIVDGEVYENQVEKTEEKTSKLDAARGKILDTNGHVIVDNEASNAVTYIRTSDTQKNHLKLAQDLAEFIDKDTEEVKERDKKDYWIASHGFNEAYEMKLSEDEIATFNEADDGDGKYETLLNRITEEDLADISQEEMEIVAIYRELNSAMMLTPHYVKKGLTVEEMARVGEHKEMLEGIDIATVSNRTYENYGKQFYLGKVGSIERKRLDYFLSRGYDRNDQVGTSYLEQYYEGVLNGTKATLSYVTDTAGKPLEEPKRVEGSRGHDIILTVNIELQEKIKEILKTQLKKYMGTAGNGYLNDAYVAMVDPQTGGVIALAGQEYEDGGFKNASYGTLGNAFAMGSAVKGATVLAGYETGVISDGTYVNDKTITVRNSPNFSSYTRNIDSVNPVGALEQSSNVYMGFIAGYMAGFDFVDQGGSYKATVDAGDQFENGFRTLRDVYSQFGLGVPTGIDLPNESIGYEGQIPFEAPGKIMQFAIGQYDTYTPIQMAQYVSTIANDGYRMQIHLMKEIREPTSEPQKSGKILYQYEPRVLNRVSMEPEHLDTVQEGFRQVTHGSRGTARALGQGEYYQYKIAGKTGTAQVDVNFDNIIDTTNSTFVGYAPYDNPEVAIAVVVPGSEKGHVNLEIAGKVFKAYFEMTEGN